MLEWLVGWNGWLVVPAPVFDVRKGACGPGAGGPTAWVLLTEI